MKDYTERVLNRGVQNRVKKGEKVEDIVKEYKKLSKEKKQKLKDKYKK